MRDDFFDKIANLLKKYWYVILILLILSLFSQTVRHFILGSIMFIALGFLFLVIGAYIYFDIIKKASKVVLDTPKNFKNLSKSLQKKNIDRTLIRLMAAMAVGVSRSQSGTGRFLQIDYDNVSKIQKALLFDMIGPMNKDEIKKECFDRFLNNPKISQIEKQGLEHVLNNFLNK